jgi:hypothetical protein
MAPVLDAPLACGLAAGAHQPYVINAVVGYSLGNRSSYPNPPVCVVDFLHVVSQASPGDGLSIPYLVIARRLLMLRRPVVQSSSVWMLFMSCKRRGGKQYRFNQDGRRRR